MMVRVKDAIGTEIILLHNYVRLFWCNRGHSSVSMESDQDRPLTLNDRQLLTFLSLIFPTKDEQYGRLPEKAVTVPIGGFLLQ